jgi:hypothetical protein
MFTMKTSKKVKNYLLNIFAFAVFAAALYLTRMHSYILFHTVSEFLSSLIALSIFIFAWNSRNIIKNNYFLFISIALLFVGIIDLIHTLAYKGMNIFEGFDSNLPTQLWIAGRYMLAISFLIGPMFLKQKFSQVMVFLIYAGITLLLLLSIFSWRIFPESYIEGWGLTSFKIYSEYFISGILLLAVANLNRFKNYFDKNLHKYLVASLYITVLAELSFTFYNDVYDIFNMTGHILKLVAYYLFYRAIIQIGLTQPYNLLFLEIEKVE